MKKSEIYEMIIGAVIESKMNIDDKIEALDALFEDRNHHLWKENNMNENGEVIS